MILEWQFIILQWKWLIKADLSVERTSHFYAVIHLKYINKGIRNAEYIEYQNSLAERL